MSIKNMILNLTIMSTMCIAPMSSWAQDKTGKTLVIKTDTVNNKPKSSSGKDSGNKRKSVDGQNETVSFKYNQAVFKNGASEVRKDKRSKIDKTEKTVK
jgi:hypothetical protein